MLKGAAMFDVMAARLSFLEEGMGGLSSAEYITIMLFDLSSKGGEPKFCAWSSVLVLEVIGYLYCC